MLPSCTTTASAAKLIVNSTVKITKQNKPVIQPILAPPRISTG
jgi:hypothetical protein